jgi:CheY-like chemotaxis protein
MATTKRVIHPTPAIGIPLGAKAGTDQRKLVLYVEDDEDSRKLVSLRLEKTYDLVLAGNDRKACEAFCNHGPKLALVLMDIELKGSRLNGIELARLVRGKLDPALIPPYANAVPKIDVPILFVTAYGQTYSRPELMSAGGDDVIQKPVSFVELHTAMARAYLKRLG